MVQLKVAVSEARRLLGHLAQFREGNGRGAGRGLGDRFAQIGQQALVVVGVQRFGGDVEGLDQGDEDAGTDGPLIGLDL